MCGGGPGGRRGLSTVTMAMAMAGPPTAVMVPVAVAACARSAAAPRFTRYSRSGKNRSIGARAVSNPQYQEPVTFRKSKRIKKSIRPRILDV